MNAHTKDGTIAFGSYVHECLRLARYLDHLIEDIEYRMDRGRIFYALDFSEIRAYVEPYGSLNRLKIFGDDSSSNLWAIHSAANDMLLLDKTRRPILLGPHMLELQAYISNLHHRGPGYTVYHVSSAMNEREKLLEQSQEVRELIHRIKKAEESASELDRKKAEADRRTVVEFVEKNAPHLLEVVRGEETSPAEVLAGLLRARPFAELWTCARDERLLAPTALPLNEQTRERWEEEMGRPEARQTRPDANYRDAFVMMLLEAIDNVLADHKSKLCLVTRSWHMHEIFERELASGLWQGRQGSLLRHPISFIAAWAERAEDQQTTKDRLKNLRASIRTFVELASATVTPSVDSTSPWAPLAELLPEHEEETRRRKADAQHLLEDIKRDWRSLVSLVAAESRHGRITPPARRRRSIDDSAILEIFRAVDDPRILNNYVHGRILQLARDIDFNYRYAAALAPGQSGLQADLAGSVRTSRGTDSVIIDATNSFAPYTIVFHSPQMRPWSRLIQSQKRIEREGILRLLENGYSSGYMYEPLLAQSYFFGASDLWGAARAFAVLAMVAHVPGDPPPGEAFLFQAICARMMDDKTKDRGERYEDSQSALELLDRAAALLGDKDPRVLTERATHLSRWRDVFPNCHETIKDAISLLDLALESVHHLNDDSAFDLEARILNNRCCLLLDLDDDRAYERASDDWQQLETLLRSRLPNQSEWPPPMVDTLLWADWLTRVQHLTGEHYASARIELMEQYKGLLGRNLPAMGRHAVYEHVRLIENPSRR